MNVRFDKQIVFPEDLERIEDGDLYEFVHGMPVEKPMGAESDEIGSVLISLLLPFCRAGKLGRVFGAATGYRCFPHDSKLVRKPDVSFIATARLAGKTPRGDIAIAPDLAVEVVSPNDLYEDVALKVVDYKLAKVRLTWVVCPATKTVLIRRLDGTCAELDEVGTLSGEDVIPGFVCPVAELFT
ncbi:MAG: Uma2 family endonuclease [Gemmataceae bacterium]